MLGFLVKAEPFLSLLSLTRRWTLCSLHYIYTHCFTTSIPVYSRPGTESFDPSLHAHTKMRSCHSTACWTFPAPANFPPVRIQHPKCKAAPLWTRRTARQVAIQHAPLKAPYVLYFAAGGEKFEMSTRATERASCWDVRFLWRHTTGARPRYTFSAPALNPTSPTTGTNTCNDASNVLTATCEVKNRNGHALTPTCSSFPLLSFVPWEFGLGSIRLRDKCYISPLQNKHRGS